MKLDSVVLALNKVAGTPVGIVEDGKITGGVFADSQTGQAAASGVNGNQFCQSDENPEALGQGTTTSKQLVELMGEKNGQDAARPC